MFVLCSFASSSKLVDSEDCDDDGDDDEEEEWMPPGCADCDSEDVPNLDSRFRPSNNDKVALLPAETNKASCGRDVLSTVAFSSSHEESKRVILVIQPTRPPVTEVFVQGPEAFQLCAVR